MNNIQVVNELLKIRSQIDNLLKELSYNENKTFKEMPISSHLSFILREMDMEDKTPIEFISKISQSEFKRHRNVGTKRFKEMLNLLSNLGLEWPIIFT